MTLDRAPGTEIQRVLVVGSAGTGKSTVAARVADRLDIPLQDLDTWRRDGAFRVPRRELEVRATQLAEQDAWCAEGIFLTWTGPLIEAADVVLWVDVSRSRSALRVLKRWWRGRRSGNGHDLRSTLRLAWNTLRPHDLAAVSVSRANLNPSRVAIAEALELHGRHPTVLRTERDLEAFFMGGASAE